MSQVLVAQAAPPPTQQLVPSQQVSVVSHPVQTERAIVLNDQPDAIPIIMTKKQVYRTIHEGLEEMKEGLDKVLRLVKETRQRLEEMSQKTDEMTAKLDKSSARDRRRRHRHRHRHLHRLEEPR